MRSLVLRRSFIALLAVLLGFGAAAAAGTQKTDVFAEFFYTYGYGKVAGHKAIAIGPYGYWQPIWGKDSAKAAADAALGQCNAGVKNQYPKLKNPCALLAVDDNLQMPLVTMGGLLDAAATGPDLPLDKGWTWLPEGPAHGSVLIITSCSRVQSADGLVAAWAYFYTALGFRVYMPDGYAEPRPPELCGFPDDRVEDQSSIIKQQMAQTRRNIATLQQRFPGEPIVLHGQGQGSWVVEALGEPVAAVIATGATCSFGNTWTHNVAADVPFLVIAGGSDSFVPSARTPESFSDYCRNVVGPAQAETLSVAGKNGTVAPWWPGVTDAISALLKVKTLALSENLVLGNQQIDMLSDDYKKYSAAAPPKAWAQNGSTRSYAWQQADVADAENYALFYCAYLMQRNPYAEPGQNHVCKLVDVKDAPPKQ